MTTRCSANRAWSASMIELEPTSPVDNPSSRIRGCASQTSQTAVHRIRTPINVDHLDTWKVRRPASAVVTAPPVARTASVLLARVGPTDTVFLGVNAVLDVGDSCDYSIQCSSRLVCADDGTVTSTVKMARLKALLYASKGSPTAVWSIHSFKNCGSPRHDSNEHGVRGGSGATCLIDDDCATGACDGGTGQCIAWQDSKLVIGDSCDYTVQCSVGEGVVDGTGEKMYQRTGLQIQRLEVPN